MGETDVYDIELKSSKLHGVDTSRLEMACHGDDICIYLTKGNKVIGRTIVNNEDGLYQCIMKELENGRYDIGKLNKNISLTFNQVYKDKKAQIQNTPYRITMEA